MSFKLRAAIATFEELLANYQKGLADFLDEDIKPNNFPEVIESYARDIFTVSQALKLLKEELTVLGETYLPEQKSA